MRKMGDNVINVCFASVASGRGVASEVGGAVCSAVCRKKIADPENGICNLYW